MIYKSCMTLRTLSYGNSGIFLFAGDAGFIFISSTVVVDRGKSKFAWARLFLQEQPRGLGST